MTDKLTEALALHQRALSALALELPPEVFDHYRAIVVPIAEDARRWRSFPTDDDIDTAEAMYIAYLTFHRDPLSDVVDTRHAAFRAALEAIKREDR